MLFLVIVHIPQSLELQKIKHGIEKGLAFYSEETFESIHHVWLNFYENNSGLKRDFKKIGLQEYSDYWLTANVVFASRRILRKPSLCDK